jgi:hypothetical protein
MSTSTSQTPSLKGEQADLSTLPLRVNPMKFLETPTKDYGYGYDEHSLTSMMSSHRSSLHSMHQKFAYEIEERRKVNFSSVEKSDPVDEPPQKRRRFQRRNSKTAAMLFSSMSSLVASDFEEDEKKEETSHAPDDSAWDGGLEIAEELVRQLKLRRQSCTGSSTP